MKRDFSGRRRVSISGTLNTIKINDFGSLCLCFRLHSYENKMIYKIRLIGI